MGAFGAAAYYLYKKVSQGRAEQKQEKENTILKNAAREAEEKKRQMERLTKAEAAALSVQNGGRVVIPSDKVEIEDNAFDKNENIISVSVPSSVKKIGDRAFADCKNLIRVELEDGLESIGSNVFNGCESLHELVIPDSVKDLYGWAFHGFTGLKKPVYSRSGDVLYCYPGAAGEKVFAVPLAVKRINSAAFINDSDLEEIILPDGLETVSYRAFMDSTIRRITIPVSVKVIENQVFYDCKSLEKIIISGYNTNIENGAFYGCNFEMEIITQKTPRFDERVHWFGASFIYNACRDLPNGHHCGNTRFKSLAAACAEGSADAMWDFGNYFLELGSHEFYTYAANFWRYRAAQKGYKAAVEWLETWLKENPQKLMPSIMDEMSGVVRSCITVGEVNGKIMKYSGFMLFDENRDYTIKAPDEKGIVVINSWCGDDGPDEDGFGREEYYDWWFADENLKQIPGTEMVHSHSYRDRTYSPRYKEQYEKAGIFMKNKTIK